MSAYDRKDYSDALTLAMRSDLSDPKILYILGRSHEMGRGIGIDYIKAERYFEMAAERGNTDAAYRLAFDYAHGLLGASNKEKARAIYEKLARNGHPLSIYAIGKYYEDKGDKGRAIQWYHRIADAMVNGEDENMAKSQAEQRLQILEP